MKSVTFGVNGQYAFGLLTSEIGVHRLVRISPFESSQTPGDTSALPAFMFLLRSIDSIEVIIKVRKICASIPIDPAASADSTRPIPPTRPCASRTFRQAIVAGCQNERSQHKNKDRAIPSMLLGNFTEHEREKKREITRKIEDSKLDIETLDRRSGRMCCNPIA